MYRLLVVADGVGGWGNVGIDPSAFSRALCSNAGKLFSTDPLNFSRNPHTLLAAANSDNFHPGSATMVVITLQPESNQINTANVGDSGYAIFEPRNNGSFRLVYKSPEQQHSFNFPFQLASPKTNDGDDPKVAIKARHNLTKQQVLIVGSDGLFDNIHLDNIAEILAEHYDFETKKMRNKKGVGKRLAELAIENGQNGQFLSPFAEHAQSLGINYVGGKLDDTTVIIVQLQDKPVPKDSELEL